MEYSEIYAVMQKEMEITISTCQLDSSKVKYRIEEFKDVAGNVNIVLDVKCMFPSTDDNRFHEILTNNLSKHYLVMGNVSCIEPLEFSITVTLPKG